MMLMQQQLSQLLFVFVCFSFCGFWLPSVQCWYVAPPRVTSEWSQLSQLVVRCFDDDVPPKNAYSNSNNSEAVVDDAGTNTNNDFTRKKNWIIQKWNDNYWSMIVKPRLESLTYQHFVSTARKMQGSKYSILLAKEHGNVVGMIEFGINSSMDPLKRTMTEDADGTNSNDSSQSCDVDSVLMKRRGRPTIGLLCVDPKYRKRGIAKELVRRSEDIVLNIWKDEMIYAEVQPNNDKAMSFFQSTCGYEPLIVLSTSSSSGGGDCGTLDGNTEKNETSSRQVVVNDIDSNRKNVSSSQGVTTVMVKLRLPQRRETEKKLHVVLYKSLSVRTE